MRNRRKGKIKDFKYSFRLKESIDGYYAKELRISFTENKDGLSITSPDEVYLGEKDPIETFEKSLISLLDLDFIEDNNEHFARNDCIFIEQENNKKLRARVLTTLSERMNHNGFKIIIKTFPNRDSRLDSSFFVTNHVRDLPNDYDKKAVEEKLADKKEFSSFDLNVKKEFPFIKILQNNEIIYEKHDERKKQIKNVLDEIIVS